MAGSPLTSKRDVIVDRLRTAGIVFAAEEADILLKSATTLSALLRMVEARANGRPLEHVVGWAEFCGVRIEVDDGVFVPRRRTEAMVRYAVTLVQGAQPPTTVVDLGCGSGAIAAALAKLIGAVQLHAVDIDSAAVRCARRNLVGLNATVYEGDLFVPLPATIMGTVDLLMSNMPYVPTAALELLPAEARLHEPRTALDGGPDGLTLIRRVISGAPAWLAPGGHVLVEVSEPQVEMAVDMVSAAGLIAQVARHSDWDSISVSGRRDAAARSPSRHG